MRSPRFRIKRRSGVLLAACGLAAILGAAAASVVYVNVERLDIVEKKRAVAKVVTTVDRNAALNVVAQEGNWYKVEIGGKQGYVFNNAVADQPGQAKGKGVNMSAVKGGSVPGLETAAAVKGIGDGARQYASGSHLRTDGLQEMIRRSGAITPADFDQFVAAGGLPVAGAAVPASSPDATRFASNEVSQ